MSEGERGIGGGAGGGMGSGGGMGPGERGRGGDESEDLALRDDDADQVRGGATKKDSSETAKPQK